MNTLLDQLIKLPMNKLHLWNVGYKCLSIGYYSTEDFVKYCLANKLPIF